jgi:hypothetical protein
MVKYLSFHNSSFPCSIPQKSISGRFCSRPALSLSLFVQQISGEAVIYSCAMGSLLSSPVSFSDGRSCKLCVCVCVCVSL